jgi:hypothetical protein
VTQIVSLVSRDFVAQVGDRRLSRRGAVVDDETNKCVLFDGRLAISYTGPSSLRGEETHLWIARTVAGSPSADLAVAARLLADNASTAVRSLRVQDRRLDIVAVGWARVRRNDDLRGVWIRVSNWRDGRVRSTFAVEVHLPTQPSKFFVTGQPMADSERERLSFALKHHTKHRLPPSASVRSLVTAVRRSAKGNELIGSTLLSAVIPRAAVSEDWRTGSMQAFTGPADTASRFPTFEYWPAWMDDGVTFGPTVAARGGVVASGFQSGPIRGALGGMVRRGDGGGTFAYPIAVLRRGGAFLTGRAGDRPCLIAFTEDSLLESYLRREVPPQTSVLLVETPDDLRALAASLDESCEQVGFNPNGVGELKVVVRLDDLYAGH